MPDQGHLAIIGSGASAIFLLKHLLDEISTLRGWLRHISIFEKSRHPGIGMPYNPETTDRYNLSNISSEELPELTESFGDWLRGQERSLLESLGITATEISDSEVYSRLALGRYLHSQYEALVAGLSAAGVQISEHPGCEIVDAFDGQEHDQVILRDAEGSMHAFDKVIIATGHRWSEKDLPSNGYFASPWPISKLLPEEGEFHNFTIGTLGASLSAFDVISSLAHRHGEFRNESGRLVFHGHPGAESFKMVMHAAQGLLPHLQFDQDEPMRVIYRHVDREHLLSLVDDKGFLRLETFFADVCRPALAVAFAKDRKDDMVDLLKDQHFGILHFVEKMTEAHAYENAFEGMRYEMTEAKDSVLNHKPIHWKEVTDDLFYTLNFHAELMPAEDHVTFRSKVMPFLLNVVAAMPLPSGATILALYDAGKLDMVSGRVSLAEDQKIVGKIIVKIENEEKSTTVAYKMFVDCSGQKPLELENYPFTGLVEGGAVRKARAGFAHPETGLADIPEKQREHVFEEDGASFYHTGGVDIDGGYRLIRKDGKPNPKIYDIAFPHTSGVRPYSYGLQACSDTGAILVKAWVKEITTGDSVGDHIEEVSKIYEEVQA